MTEEKKAELAKRKLEKRGLRDKQLSAAAKKSFMKKKLASDKARKNHEEYMIEAREENQKNLLIKQAYIEEFKKAQAESPGQKMKLMVKKPEASQTPSLMDIAAESVKARLADEGVDPNDTEALEKLQNNAQ